MDYSGFRLLPLIPLQRGRPRDSVMVSPIVWDERSGFQPDGMRWGFDNYSRWLKGQLPRGLPWVMTSMGDHAKGPDYAVVKATRIRGVERWFDSSVHNLDDVFDSFSLDVDRLLLSSLTAESIMVMQEAHEISDACTPLLLTDGQKVFFGNGKKSLRDAVWSIESMGFLEAVLMDLSSLGRGKRPGNLLFKDIPTSDLRIIPAGGITERDIPHLQEWGYDTAIRDPFVPPLAPIGEGPLPMVEPTYATVTRSSGRPFLDPSAL